MRHGLLSFRAARQIPLMGLIALLWLILSACNLSGSSEPTAQPIPNTKPSVVITAPRSGDSFPINTQVLVSATATDTVGITRVQLIVDGRIVDTATANGERTFTAGLDFTPTQLGNINVQVIAYRSSVASDPASIQISAVAPETATPTRTPQIGVTSIVPTSVPYNPTCRIRTTSGVNLRPGPGTNYNPPLLLIPANVEGPIIGRLFDNTWWYIRYGNTNGWVSANVVQVLGNCFSIPIVPAPPTPTFLITIPVITLTPSATATQPVPPSFTPGLPDLIVTQINVPSGLTLGGDGTVTTSISAVITNNGTGGTGQFTNNLTVTPGSGVQSSIVGSLGPGQSTNVEFSYTFTSAGNYTIQVQADSGLQVTEVSDVNNTGTINVNVSPAPV